MLKSTFDELPKKVQEFIDATNVPLSFVNVNDFSCVLTPKVYFIKQNGKVREKTCTRFSLRDADRIRLWWAN